MFIYVFNTLGLFNCLLSCAQAHETSRKGNNKILISKIASVIVCKNKQMVKNDRNMFYLSKFITFVPRCTLL